MCVCVCVCCVCVRACVCVCVCVRERDVVMLQSVVRLSQSNSRWHWGTVLKLTLFEWECVCMYCMCVCVCVGGAGISTTRSIQPRLRLHRPIRRPRWGSPCIVLNDRSACGWLELGACKVKNWELAALFWAKLESGQCRVSVLVCVGCGREIGAWWGGIDAVDLGGVNYHMALSVKIGQPCL